MNELMQSVITDDIVASLDHSYYIQPKVIPFMPNDPVEKIATACRICTGTLSKISDNKEENASFVRRILSSGHRSVMEHYRITIKTDRVFDPGNMETLHAIYNMNKRFLVAPMCDFESFEVEGNLRAWYDAIVKMNNFFGYSFAYQNKPKPTIAELSSSKGTRLNYKELSYFSFLYELHKNYGVFFDNVMPVADIENLTREESTLFKTFEMHESSLYFTYILDTSRDVTHQIVRHRLDFSYSQESQRYCKYKNKVRFIRFHPDIYTDLTEDKKIIAESILHISCDRAAEKYKELLDMKIRPEHARGVLPNNCATKIMITAPIDAWKSFFELRCESHAQIQIRDIANNIQKHVNKATEIVFNIDTVEQ